MRRNTLHLTFGTLPLEVWPDGRVLVTLPPTLLPFGVALAATVVYPSLSAFLAASRSFVASLEPARVAGQPLVQ